MKKFELGVVEIPGVLMRLIELARKGADLELALHLLQRAVESGGVRPSMLRNTDAWYQAKRLWTLRIPQVTTGHDSFADWFAYLEMPEPGWLLKAPERPACLILPDARFEVLCGLQDIRFAHIVEQVASVSAVEDISLNSYWASFLHYKGPSTHCTLEDLCHDKGLPDPHVTVQEILCAIALGCFNDEDKQLVCLGTQVKSSNEDAFFALKRDHGWKLELLSSTADIMSDMKFLLRTSPPSK